MSLYHVIITDLDGQTTASRPLTKQGALDCFNIIADFGPVLPVLRPGGGGVRVVAEREWAAIRAISERRRR